MLSGGSQLITAFQPTLPARGATTTARARTRDAPISTHAPRTGSDMIISAISGTIAISTHAPRTGSDLLLVILVLADCDFNPRSPHGERQNQSSYATIPPISTHAPRTGSDGMPLVQAYRDAPISTHAPRTGSDRKSSRLTTPRSDFNPRSPHGERRAPARQTTDP